MVNVAGLALAVDAVDKEHLGEILGYLGTASMIGIISGPPLGGLAYHAGGYYAVCGLAFAMIAVDLVLRVVVIEKRRAGELSKPVDDNTTTEGLRNGYSSFPRDQIEDVPQSEGKGVFAILTLLKQPRMLITLWAFVAEGIVTASFDAVCLISSPLQYTDIWYRHWLASWRRPLDGALFKEDWSFSCWPFQLFSSPFSVSHLPSGSEGSY